MTAMEQVNKMVTGYHKGTYEFPALIGSEKQVAWANKIRNPKLLGLMNDYNDSERSAQALLRLAQQTQAAFWIENRESYTAILTAEAKKGE